MSYDVNIMYVIIDTDVEAEVALTYAEETKTCVTFKMAFTSESP